jgi:predicted CxxxxCH...CXXCH cytochrome family protein
MSQITKHTLTGLLLLSGLLFMAGCGSSTPNSKASTGATTEGQHAAEWLPAGHMIAAQEDQSACTECHGQYYDGGISGVSCTSCHLGGPSSKHPVDWFLPQLWKKHAGYATTNGNTACANAVCHGSTLSGVANSGPSCTSCHLGGTMSIHPTTWGTGTTGIDQNHAAYASSNGTDACANASCHGSTLTGVDGSGPSCSSCHLGGPTLVHPADWNVDIEVKHKAYVDTNTSSSCANSACHGTDLGGVSGSGPSCSNCHLGGATSVHPTSWTVPIALSHASTVQASGTSSCANASCHGASLTGGTGPSCSSCHMGGATSVHPASFGTTTHLVDLNHGSYVTVNGTTGCQNNYCHGSSLTGVVGSGPSCVTAACHQNGSPLIFTGCTSCHGKPPTGTVYPNVKGAHAPHNALAHVTSVCDTCHNGAGTNTVNHYNGVVNVLILSTYNAKNGSAVYNLDGTCSTVSCHGGQQTPVWITGAIDVNTQCTSCHVSGTALATPEYNSFYSGQHDVHVSVNGIACTECHDTTLLAVEHFTTLNTTMMEGSAPATIIKSFDYVGGSCSPGCHETRTW